MKKFLLLCMLVLGLSSAVCAEEYLFVQDGADEPEPDEEGVYHAPYVFPTLEAALDFAGSEPETEDESDFSEIVVVLSSDLDLSSELDFSSYGFTRLTLRGDHTITASSGIRHIVMSDSGPEIVLEGLTLNGDNSGGGADIRGGQITFNRVRFSSNNHEGENGGALYVTGGTVNVADASTFNLNRADNGGAVYVSGGTVSITDSTFSNNVAENGGALYVSGGTVNVAGNAGNVTFSNNSAQNGNGGAVYFIEGGNLEFSGVTSFNGNTATGDYEDTEYNGGALYLERNVVFNGEAHLVNNEADYGGAVYLAETRSAGLTFRNATGDVDFTGNSSKYNGGAIYAAQGSSMTFSSSNKIFDGNKAGVDDNDGSGGAIYVQQVSQLPEATITFTNNEASLNGGAIAIAPGDNTRLTLGEGSTRHYSFSGNTAEQNGGAIYAASGDITCESIDITETNTAINGGGGFICSGGAITINDSRIERQRASHGGAICTLESGTVTINNSELNRNQSTVIQGQDGGGAIWTQGTLNINDSTFSGNSATNEGGAVFASAIARIVNSYFNDNEASGNGGALRLGGSATITQSTLEGNVSDVAGGGIYSNGTIEARLSYFIDNSAGTYGGGIYFDHYNNNITFRVEDSMFTRNTAGTSGTGYGAALSIKTDISRIDRCTFNGNQSYNTGAGRGGAGGAVHLEISSGAEGNEGTIYNSTFTGNGFPEGSNNNGGALYITENTTAIIGGCTFTRGNTTPGRGGAVYVGANSVLTIFATIIVGNDTDDIWADSSSTITSTGYNRIGIYGRDEAEVTWEVDLRSATDISSRTWTTETFFGENVLADNIVPSDSTKPPYIGSTRTAQVRIQTIMLDDEDLPAGTRATSSIPYTRRYNYRAIQNDARGYDRWSARVNFDSGAVFNDNAARTGGDDTPTGEYAIENIMMSGVPNTMRGYGQTASLIALIKYTNGTYAYGGDRTGEEPVVWGIEPENSNVLTFDQKGNYTVNRIPTGTSTYVTITVRTQARKNDGTFPYAKRPVMVIGAYTYLNISPVSNWPNELNNYIYTLTEHDMSLRLTDVSTSAVESSAFQRNFAGIWSSSASQVTNLTTTTPSFTTLNSYATPDGYGALKGAGVNINFQDRDNGDLFPLTYTWKFSGEEVSRILGYDLPDKDTSERDDENVSDNIVSDLFSHLRIEFQGTNGTWPVVGSGGVDAVRARNASSGEDIVLSVRKSDSGRGVQIELTAYLANVGSVSASSGPQLVQSSGRQLLVVPDGIGDGAIYGTMWITQKGGTSQSGGGSSGSSSDEGGGGGGCEAFGVGIVGAVIVLALKRR